MVKIIRNGTTLSVKSGFDRVMDFDFNKLRLAYLVTTDNMRGFLTLSSWDIYTIDIDDSELSEAVDTIAGVYNAQKSGGLSTVKLCLADYGNNRLVMNLKKFHKAGIDLFGLLNETREARIATRNAWLATEPSVTLQGKMTINSEGAKFSERKKISWNEVDTIQLDKQESLITITNLLLIPVGVSSGAFSFKKYKYALRSIPGKLAELYLAECLFWKNYTEDKAGKKIDAEAGMEPEKIKN